MTLTSQLADRFVGVSAVLAMVLLSRPALVAAACGDGALDGADGCDDGNDADGDGCSSLCVVESGFACATQPAVAITNGSFELEPFTNGWTLAEGSVDWTSNTEGSGCWPSGDGGFSVDANGMTRGRIYQDIVTVPGVPVTVSFLGNANCRETGAQPCNLSCVKRLTVSVHDVATDAAFASAAYDFSGSPQVEPWRPATFTFVPLATRTRLSFTGSDPSLAGPMFDRVRVAASVCVPMTCGDGTLAGLERCDDGNTRAGDGCGSDCLTELGWMCPIPPMPCTSTCGDGIAVPSEGCDDGNTMPGDGCGALCAVEPGFVCIVDPFTNTSVCSRTCGNGASDPGEVCDDGNMVPNDACSNTCLRGPREPCVTREQCNLDVCTMDTCAGCYDTAAPGASDFGCGAALPACDTGPPLPVCVECLVDADCAAGESCGRDRTCVRTSCGDGVLAAPEACDDGNVLVGDGCSATCTIEMGFACAVQRPIPITNGSFELEPFTNGWTLATGSVDWESGVRDGMCWPAGDGDRTIDMNGSDRGRIYQDIATVPGETVTVSFLGSANCREVGPDACDLRCSKRITVSVHDAATDAPFASAAYDLEGSPQAAGWRNTTFTFVARETTTRLSFTGSDPSLAGPMIDRVAISASVCVATSCGDGTLRAPEECDDGNALPGDGCGPDCRNEPGWLCPPPPMPCTSTCGDGVTVPTEACDDGNTTAGDGCTASCTVEPGFVCLVDPFTTTSRCFRTCGDGTLDLGELCDDGNTVDTDACSNTCLLGPGEPCVVDPQCQLGSCPGMFCAGCFDTAPPGGLDFGCDPTRPACDTSGPLPLCVECTVSADCDASEICVTQMCVPVGTDAGPLPDASMGRDASLAGDAGASDASMGVDAPFVAIDAGRVGGASGGACVCNAGRAPLPSRWLALFGATTVLFARRRRAQRAGA